MQEIFKSLDFLGYPNYVISNLGNVINIKRNKLISPQNYQGYLCYSLSNNNIKKWFKAHRLVALAFLPNPNNLPFVNHKDENKSNNCVDNLEWCTASYNNNYGSRIEKCKNSLKQSKEQRCNRKDLSLQVKQIDAITNQIIAIYPSIREAARVVANDSNKCASILCCCKHYPKYYTAFGFKWEYV